MRSDSIASPLAAIIALRTAINAVIRAPMPFLGAIAAAFGAAAASVGWIGLAFSLAGVLSPLAGILEVRLGRRGAALASMGLFVSVCMLLPFAPTLTVAALGFVLLGVAKALFEPQTLAFLSEIVPFERRGMAVGLVELSWALAWIIGTPLMGWFVDLGRWWLLFVLMGAAAAVCTVIFLRMMNAHPVGRTTPTGGFSMDGVRAVLRSAPARRMLLFSVLISAPAQLTTLVYGPWMQQQFALTPTLLGITSIVIGLADLLAELATALFVDRLGKRTSLILSTALYALALAAFWLMAGQFVPALLGLFLVFFFFEFALVTSLAVHSEMVPSARATMAGFVAASHNTSRMAASLAALPLFVAGSLAAPTLFGAGLIAVATVVAIRMMPAMKSGKAG